MASWRSPPSSSPSSPLQTPQFLSRGPPPLTLAESNPTRRLLIPCVRPVKSTTQLSTPRSPRHKQKLTRQSRPGSLQLELLPPPSISIEAKWVSKLGKFEILQDHLEVEGYQIYAVEKWVVERTRLVTVVVVFTGDVHHKIAVTVIRPSTALSEVEAEAEFNAAVHGLRRDGARPKETSKGVIMVTSLAHFRSDLNIIAIPNGNFLAAQDRLFVNINLLRMGCSGRNALTLEEPSETTKSNFLQLYRIPESVLKDVPFGGLVLELVKLAQAGLALFGMFDTSPEERNGLLCDITDNGIRRWTDEIGSPILSLEPMERVLDPAILSALLSLCVTMRNRLNVIGISQTVPRDPFQDPAGFLHALAFFLNTRHTIHRQSSPAISMLTQGAHLTSDVIAIINEAYSKLRQNEPYKVRALMHGLGDLAAGGLHSLRNPESGLAIMSPGTSTATLDHCVETAILDDFVKTVVMLPPRDAIDSIRLVWTGRTATGRRRDREKEKEWDGEERDRTDGKSDEEVDVFSGLLWKGTGRVGRKIESGWKGLGRSKRPSMEEDFSRPGSPHVSISGTPSALVPSFIVNSPSGGEEEELANSAGENMDGSRSPFKTLQSSAQSSIVNISDYDRRVKKFNQTRPINMDSWRHAVTSWSDPSILTVQVGPDGTSHLAVHELFESESPAGSDVVLEERGQSEDEGRLKRTVPASTLRKQLQGRRRYSFNDLELLRDAPRIKVERMRIDVLLCRQYYVLQERELQMRRILSLLPALYAPLASLNEQLIKQKLEYRDKLVETEDRAHDLASGIHKIRASNSESSTTLAVLRYRVKEVRKTAVILRDHVARLQHLVRRERNRLYFPEHREYLGDQVTDDEDAATMKKKTVDKSILAFKCPFLRLCARLLIWILLFVLELLKGFFGTKEEYREGWMKDMKGVWVNIATGMTETDEEEDRLVQELSFEKFMDEFHDRERKRDNESVRVLKAPLEQDASISGLRLRGVVTSDTGVTGLGLQIA